MTSVFSWQNSVSLWPCFILSSKPTCLLLQISLYYYFCIPVPYDKKDIFFLVLVLEVPIALHRTIQFQRKVMPKNVQTNTQLHSSHMLANNAQNSPSQALTVCEPRTLDVQAGFRKGTGTRDLIASICGIIEKARECRKTSTSASLTMLKPLAVFSSVQSRIRVLLFATP